jgi:hypothetical protein
MKQKLTPMGRLGFIFVGMLWACLTLGAAVADEAATRSYTPSDKAFSFVPPQGWEEKEMPGIKYKVFITQPAENFAPNINIVDEASNLPLKEYVDANRKALAGTIEGFKELSLEPFTAAGKLQGYRLSFKNRHMETDLIQTQYYFSTPQKKIVVTCSMAEKDRRPIASQCDHSLKTFQAGVN